MLREYDVVRLKQDRPSECLTTHDIGTIVMVYQVPSIAYEVEFTDADGGTLALLTLQEEDIQEAQEG